MSAACGGGETAPGSLERVSPVASILEPAGATLTIVQGGQLRFVASCAASGDGQVRHAWRFGGGAPATGDGAHAGLVAFATAGAYTVTYTCTDAFGLSAADTRTIRVERNTSGPAAMVAVSALAQAAAPGAAVADPPVVQVTDGAGAPVAGLTVVFTVSEGGGVVEGSPAVTDADGMARLTSWTSGTTGEQVLIASVPLAPSLTATFTASLLEVPAPAPATPPYRLDLRLLTPVTAGQQAALDRAKARLEQLIVGDLPNVRLTIPPDPSCGDVAIGEEIDDLVVLVRFEPIDGTGGILGQAGPCYVRRSGGLPLLGILQLDTADLAALEASGKLESVILHEMLHVAGVGTVWEYVGLLSGSGTSDPRFTGLAARDAFLGFDGGETYGGTPVPVENTGGPGTADGHWRESVFGRELMTGWISGGAQPLSRTTAASLADLGYQVDLSRADAFSIATPFLLDASDDVHVGDDVLRIPLQIVP